MSFLEKKKIYHCKCAANKNCIYSYTYNETFGNCNTENIDILILLEHKEIPIKMTLFKNLCKKYFKDYKYQIIPALGCTPKDFSSSDTINTYVQCKQKNINKKIKYYNPKVILTTGRALYTITESKELKPNHFFVPVNNSLQDYQINDTFIYSSEFDCNVYPIPALYQWIKNSVLDTYEYKFCIQQFERIILDLSKRKRKPDDRNLIYCEEPNDFLQKIINDTTIKVIAIDIETSGFNYFEDQLYTIQFSIDSISGYFCYFDKINKELLTELFNRKDIDFVYQHAQFDIKFLKSNGIKNARCDFDIMLASHILNENNPNGLKSNVWLYTQFGGYDNKVKKYIKENKINSFLDLPKNLLLEYACYDVILTYELYKYFKNRLEQEDIDVKNNFYNYVMPTVEMIIDVEMTGVQIDMNYLNEYVSKLKQQAKEIEKEIYKIAGRQFNINSGKELSKVLLKIPGFKILTDNNNNKLLTKNGDLKLNKDTVDRYFKEYNLSFIKKISKYNHITKEISQFGFTLKKEEKEFYIKKQLFDNKKIENEQKKDKGFIASMYEGKLYGGYKLHGTGTGRMSGGGGLNSSINWQNMPATIEFRKIFLPTLGYIYGVSDYDAMEICIASQIAGSGILESLILEGKDMHCYTAVSLMKMFGIETTYEEVFNKTKIEGQEDEEFVQYRVDSKGVNFSGLYGSTKYGMSSSFGVSIEQGEKFLNAFYESYPEIKEYMDEYREFAKNNGYVKTLLGRKKRLPELTYIGRDSFKNYNSSFSLNNLLNLAINAPIQGTSGQTTLLAMINIWKEFKKQNMKSKIIINVHDEIVFELHLSELNKAEDIIKYWMEFKYYKNKKNCKVVLTAGLNYGEIWKAGKSKQYWDNNQEEWKQCLLNTENRNIK